MHSDTQPILGNSADTTAESIEPVEDFNPCSPTSSIESGVYYFYLQKTGGGYYAVFWRSMNVNHFWTSLGSL